MSDIIPIRRLGILTVVAVAVAGASAVIGGGTVYFLFLRRKIYDEFSLQRRIFRAEVENLRAQVQQLIENDNSARQNHVNATATNANSSNSAVNIPNERKLKSSLKPERRTVKFANGYETADDDEYITASSTSEEDDDMSPTSRLNRFPSRIGGGDGAFMRDKSLSASQGQEASKFFKKVDDLFEGSSENQHEAFSLLKSNIDKFIKSADFWWRLAKATHLEATTAGNNGDRETKKTLEFEAFSYAEKAIDLSTKISDAHKWYAITLGSKGEFVSTNEKIQNGFVFKEHIDKAIELNPTDATLHHLLGRFCYEVSQLSWLERQVASTLFSTPPSSSPQEALEHFQNSERIAPRPFKDNRLFVAKCYISMGDYKNTAKWLSLASKLPVVTATDKGAQDEINKLFPKYQRYMD